MIYHIKTISKFIILIECVEFPYIFVASHVISHIFFCLFCLFIYLFVPPIERLQFADPVTLKNVVLHEASLLESEFEVKSDVDQSVLEKLESPLGVVTEYLESGEETPKLLSLSVATDILSRSPSLHLLGGVPGAIIEVSRRLMATGLVLLFHNCLYL